MKILLINPPQDEEVVFVVPKDYDIKARNYQPPLGLMYLYPYLITKHDVFIVDMAAKGNTISDIVTILEQYKPDIVGLTCVISKWTTVIKLAKYIKEYGATVVVGGVNPSLYTYETLRCRDIDFAIRGFGQIPFMELCDQLENGGYKGNINNCFTRDEYPDRIPGVFAFEDLDKYSFPRRDILPLDDYNALYSPENPTTSFLTSLGCPHKCAYCPCRLFKPITVRNPDNVTRELQEIQDLGIKSISVQDELFTMSRKRILDICSSILSKNISLHWAIKARSVPLDIDSLSLMKQAGCYNIHMGIESGNKRILDKMDKRTTPEQIIEAVKRIKSIGLSCSASFMLGYPTETEAEIMETINFASNLDLNVCQFYITAPAPDTKLYLEWQQNTGYQGNIFSDFVLNHYDISLENHIASDIFTKKQLTEFVDFAYSKTNNLYKIRQSGE